MAGKQKSFTGPKGFKTNTGGAIKGLKTGGNTGRTKQTGIKPNKSKTNP